jgi:hypothetical protein
VVLVNANGTTSSFLFALGSINSGISAAGRVVEFDDASGGGTRASGTMRLQDASSFTVSQIKGNYAFGALSMQQAVAGTFTSDGISTITTNTVDADFSGTVTSNATSTPGGSFTCCSANGRGLLQITSPLGLAQFAMYVINSGDVLLVSDMAYGEAIGISSATTFSQTSLSGTSVLRETAQSNSGPIAGIATESADGKGTITANESINSAGAFSASTTALTYVVGSNGRVALSGGSSPAALYLYGPNQGFLVGTDANVTFGILEPQAAGPFSNSSFAGPYTIGTENPSANTVTIESGVVTADGTGNAGGTSDQSSPSGPPDSQSLNITYSIGADGTGNVGNGTTMIMISAGKLVFIDQTSANPTITVLEK